jgi:hypothetical protein
MFKYAKMLSMERFQSMGNAKLHQGFQIEFKLLSAFSP